MKKKLALCLSLLMFGSLMACTPKAQEGASSGNNTKPGDTAAAGEEYFEWSVYDDTAIEGYTELGLQQTELVIPAKCTSLFGLGENPNLKEVTFENPDTEILSGTFADCTALERVQLPANLEAIPDSCFTGCESLQSIVIPDSVKEIQSNAFWKCAAMESVTLPQGLETIGWYAFSECKALKEITIPDAVTTIEADAFSQCESLATVTFGTGLTTVGDYAFRMCNSLKSVKLQEGVTTLGTDAFALCDSLQEVYLPASIQEAAYNALAQTHPIKVYVVQGSYMDGRLAEMMGPENFEKLYQ